MTTTNPRAYVLMTAMPPTKGHLALIQFASNLGETAEVILCTQPDEPFWQERLDALRSATAHIGNVNIHHIHKELPQEPEEAVGFWDMWAEFLTMFGLQKNDYIVASEKYGKKLAEVTGSRFMPYDIDRSINFTKATQVRNDPYEHFSTVLPEFQPYLRKTVTIFGAESTGKTTLSKMLAEELNGWWLFEWARPYLENVENVITQESMTEIWHGQAALQRQGAMMLDKPLIVQDTDLYSTIGYWEMWDIDSVPDGLDIDAQKYQSDLYIITPSNIPFEADPLRYGGDKRESSDQYWIDLCEQLDLNYVVLDHDCLEDRYAESIKLIMAMYEDTAGASIKYTRR